MPRFYRSNNLVLSDEVFTVLDDEPEEKPYRPHKEEDDFIPSDSLHESTEWDPESFAETFAEFDGDKDAEFSGAIGYSEVLAQEMLQKAKEEAALIVNKANLQAQLDHDRLLAQTTAELETIKKQAYEEAFQLGMVEGAREQIASITGCIEAVEAGVSHLEGEQAGFMAEYEYNLKWLAWEIASKVLGRRLEQDDTEMLSLVKTAVASVKNAKWIAVEVSEKMTTLIDQLTQELKRTGNDHIEIRGVSAPEGYCVVDTPDGLLDASVYSQLENLRLYFAKEDN